MRSGVSPKRTHSWCSGAQRNRSWHLHPDDASQPKHDIRARRSDYFTANAKHLDHFPESRHSGGGSGPD